MKKALVVGFGQIGAMHARMLSQLECDVAVVSQREVNFPKRFKDIPSALKSHKPEYVVVANSTNRHISALTELKSEGFQGVLLVEKPLSVGSEVVPDISSKFAGVGYNLRFHPLVQELHRRLLEENLVALHVYCGAYLPDLKPGSDYRNSYSAKQSEGGGALRDFSHEIDYALWMAGPWRKLSAMGGHVSPLEMSSDDIFCVNLQTEKCPLVTINVNYLDRTHRRELIAHTSRSTIVADLLTGTIHDQESEGEFEGERDATFRAMHMAMLEGDTSAVCSLKEGIAVQKTIEAIEKSAREGVILSA